MAASAGTGLGTSTLLAGASVLAIVGVVGYQVFFAPDPETAAPEAAVSETVAAPAAVAVPEAAAPAASGDTAALGTQPDTQPEPGAAPDMPAPARPSFDLVRVDAAGGALIAGQAGAGANLRLLLDGEEIHLADADGAGAFVAMFDIPPSELPRVLSLEAIQEDGSVLVSEQSVIISPTLRPVDGAGDTEVATAETGGGTTAAASGPDVPQDSGVTELALAEDPVTAPSGTAPQLAPASPDLPEQAAGGEAPTVPGADADSTTTGASGAADPASPDSPPAVDQGTAEAADAPASEGSSEDTTEVAGTGMPEQPAAEPAVTTETADTADAAAPETATAESGTDPAQSGGTGSVVAEVTDTAEPAQTLEVAALDTAAAETDPPASEASTQSGTASTAGSDAASDAPVAAAETTEMTAPGSSAEADSPAEGSAPVMEQTAPTVLLADREGIRVVQQGGPGPEVQAQVTLDTIAYDTEGDVVMAGRGPAESDVHFYLDNQPIHLAQIGAAGGWSTELPQVDPGTYTLRLDQVDAEGTVSSRIETPFLREEPETIRAITTASGESVVTVQWGNTLWAIAQELLGDGVMYVQIYEANREQIRNPDLIYPGQIFTIPEAD
jgi:nucleoid-associated protein YgaU